MTDKTDAPTAEMVLAAIERAIRQSPRPLPDASPHGIADHLAINIRSGRWRTVRAHLRELESARQLTRGRRNGLTVWGLTDAGRRRLERARQDGTLPALPESPQHRVWRDARRLAAQEIERFRAELAEALGEGLRLLDRTGVSSAVWMELSKRLARAAEHVASAVHCLNEWPEPDEGGPDVVGAGLRNTARWSL